jgi:hypothetical protein
VDLTASLYEKNMGLATGSLTAVGGVIYDQAGNAQGAIWGPGTAVYRNIARPSQEIRYSDANSYSRSGLREYSPDNGIGIDYLTGRNTMMFPNETYRQGFDLEKIVFYGDNDRYNYPDNHAKTGVDWALQIDSTMLDFCSVTLPLAAQYADPPTLSSSSGAAYTLREFGQSTEVINSLTRYSVVPSEAAETMLKYGRFASKMSIAITVGGACYDTWSVWDNTDGDWGLLFGLG